MAQYDYDLVVIGAGSGGVGLARRAASHGARVAICEESAYGGTCVHRGCVPKKLLVYASHLKEDLDLLPGYGFEAANPTFNWSGLIANVNKELNRLNDVYQKLLDGSGVTRLSGRGRFRDANTVEINNDTVTAKYIAVATGAKSLIPDLDGIEHAKTSDDLFKLKELPRHITLIGSGYIGLEFACIFAGLGSSVTLMYRSELPLPHFDYDIRKAVAEELRHKNIVIHHDCRLQQLHKDGTVETNCGTWKTELFVNATGRVPNTEHLNLAAAGVETGSHGKILVDELNQTNVPNIFALGDCTGGVQLTPYAIAKGRALGERLFNPNNKDFRADFEFIPTAVFTTPAVGVVGLTQKEAEAQHPGDIDIYRTRFRPMKYTLPDRPEKVLIKIVVRRSDQKVLGCHMVGNDAPEVIQTLAIALTCGATKTQFDQTLAVHPTAAEEFVLLRDPVKETQ